MDHSGDSRAAAAASGGTAQVALSALVDEARTNGDPDTSPRPSPTDTAPPPAPLIARPATSAAKRGFDLLLCLLAAPIAVPVCLAIAVLIKVSSGGPVLFRQKRPGLGGTTIEMLKFRTMHVDAEQRLVDDPVLNAEFVRSGYKLENDPRLTRVGKLLRKISLDELPQILNVLFGTMSWVGPRPLLLAELDEHVDMTSYYSVRPGITGLWQVSGRSNADKETLWNEYVETWSMWLDVKILLKTPVAVITGQGAF